MNKQLQKKLLSYSVCAGACLAIDKQADGQIIYHQVNPNFTINESGQYFLDLNGDGTYDFNFVCPNNYPGAVDVNANGLNSNSFFAYPENNGSSASSFIVGTRNEQIAYKVFSRFGTVTSSFVLGPWGYAANKFMPLKVISGGNTYMGWARLSVGLQGAEFKIIDYAYNATPTNTIIMGDMGCAYTPITPVISLHSGDTLKSTASKSYQWLLNGAPLASDTAQAFAALQPGIYSVITTDTGGCKTQSNAVNYTLCSNKHLPVTAVSTTGCGELNASLQGDSIPYGYTVQWYSGDTAITHGGNASFYKGQFLSSTTLYFIATNSFTGCSDTSKTIPITVYPVLPSPVFSQHGDSLITTVKGNYAYQWLHFGSPITGANASYFLPGYSSLYTLEITDTITGCTAEVNGNFNACYYIADSIRYVSGPAIGCVTDTVTLKMTPYDSVTYQWYNGNGIITGATDSIYKATQPGVYYVDVTDSAKQCVANTSTYEIVQAYAPAIPPVFQNNDTLITGAYYSYQWYVNDDSIPGATNQYLIADTAGTYKVDVFNEAGCRNFSDPFIIVSTAVQTMTADNPVTVYTNADNIYVKFFTDGFLNGTVTLFNIEGQKLQQKIITGNLELLSGQQLPKGMYFVSVTKNELTHNFKIVLL